MYSCGKTPGFSFPAQGEGNKHQTPVRLLVKREHRNASGIGHGFQNNRLAVSSENFPFFVPVVLDFFVRVLNIPIRARSGPFSTFVHLQPDSSPWFRPGISHFQPLELRCPGRITSGHPYVPTNTQQGRGKGLAHTYRPVPPRHATMKAYYRLYQRPCQEGRNCQRYKQLRQNVAAGEEHNRSLSPAGAIEAITAWPTGTEIPCSSAFPATSRSIPPISPQDPPLARQA